MLNNVVVHQYFKKSMFIFGLVTGDDASSLTFLLYPVIIYLILLSTHFPYFMLHNISGSSIFESHISLSIADIFGIVSELVKYVKLVSFVSELVISVYRSSYNLFSI